MVTVKIGASERKFERVDNIEESWINQQVNGLKKDGHSVCIRISINQGAINLSLATPDCSMSGGSRRPPNTEERRIFEIWDSLGLNNSGVQGGKLIAFFKQIRRITG
jgi:hypothetical protein